MRGAQTLAVFGRQLTSRCRAKPGPRPRPPSSRIWFRFAELPPVRVSSGGAPLCPGKELCAEALQVRPSTIERRPHDGPDHACMRSVLCAKRQQIDHGMMRALHVVVVERELQAICMPVRVCGDPLSLTPERLAIQSAGLNCRFTMNAAVARGDLAESTERKMSDRVSSAERVQQQRRLLRGAVGRKRSVLLAHRKQTPLPSRVTSFAYE